MHAAHVPRGTNGRPRLRDAVTGGFAWYPGPILGDERMYGPTGCLEELEGPKQLLFEKPAIATTRMGEGAMHRTAVRTSQSGENPAWNGSEMT